MMAVRMDGLPSWRSRGRLPGRQVGSCLYRWATATAGSTAISAVTFAKQNTKIKQKGTGTVPMHNKCNYDILTKVYSF